MPAATTVATQDKKPEPVATFSLGDSMPASSPKHVQQSTPIKPPPPGAVHCKLETEQLILVFVDVLYTPVKLMKVFLLWVVK